MITTIQFKTLDDLYRFYNQAIFGGELSDCIVNMSRHGGAYGFLRRTAGGVRTKPKRSFMKSALTLTS